MLCSYKKWMNMLTSIISQDIIDYNKLGSQNDIHALLEAINAGVTIICTIHVQSLEDIKKRPSIQPLFQQHIFKRLFILDNSGQPGIIKKVYNEDQQIVLQT